MNTTAEKVTDDLARFLRDTFGNVPDTQVFVAPDPAAGLELLAGGRPGGRTVVVFYDGDVPADPNAPAGDTLVTARLTVAAAGHPGLSAPESRDAPGVLAFAGALRAALVAADPEAVFGGYTYTGMSYVRDTQGAVLHGYALTFEATYAFRFQEN